MDNIQKELYNSFKSFINDINPLIDNNSFIEYYKSFLNDDEITTQTDNHIIEDFIKDIDTNMDSIINEDPSVLDQLSLKHIDLKDLWDNVFNDDMKQIIWKYLQTFSIISINMNSSNELKELLKGDSNKKHKRKDINDLKRIKQLKSNISNNTVNTDHEKQSDNSDDFHKILNNTNIGALAHDIASSIDMKNIIGDISGSSNPDDIMANLFQPDKFSNIFSTINNTLQEKMESGEYNNTDMEEEAQKLFPSFKDNPMFKNIQGMQQSQNVESQKPKNNKNVKNINIKKNKTKERLQRKLKQKEGEKKSINVNKQ